MTDSSNRPVPQTSARSRSLLSSLVLTLLVVTLAGGSAYLLYQAHASATVKAMTLMPGQDVKQAGRDQKPMRAPERDGGIEWLNCGGPIRLKDLRGKVVLLDFWTYCCINCIHVMPDLAKLEKKYPNELVVIGVHSAKFDTEKDSKNIREAILRYNIEHPVVNDAEHKIWREYRVRSWPTFWLIDPEGNLVGQTSGEGVFDLLDEHIEKQIKLHREKKTLNDEPIRFDLAKFRERKTTPLYFPGKVVADVPGNRLFIADSTHHRLVITDLNGKKLDIVGTGREGLNDGTFEEAAFDDPQGMALKGEILYVADRKNHVLRAVDLKGRKVATVAGTGEQANDRASRSARGDARKISLNSPWDLWLHGDDLYIAMAGHHQLWRMNLKTSQVAPYAGTGGEDLLDGSLSRSLFAQPSGLTSDGTWLYVADSEVSAIRAVPFDENGKVKTLVGEGLFTFGDVDGVGDEARLQHALGVAFHQGKLYVADTYNNKIKVLDPATRGCTTFLGTGKPGKTDDPPLFDEPAGLSIGGDNLYVADTNNHSIRIIDLKTKSVRTLQLEGVTPPTPPKVSARPVFVNPSVAKVPEATIPKTGDVLLEVKLELPMGFKLSPLAPMNYLIETSPAGQEQMGMEEGAKPTFTIKVPADKLGEAKSLKVSLAYFICQEGGEGICQTRSQVWEVPLRVQADAKPQAIPLKATVTAGDKKKGEALIP